MQVHLFGNSNSLWDKRWNSPNYLNFGVALIFPESAYVIQIYAFFIDCACSGIQVTLFVIVNCNCVFLGLHRIGPEKPTDKVTFINMALNMMTLLGPLW
jgi:hypothetical protein